MWDIVGKSVNKPIHKLIGGAYRTEVTCYATGLYFIDMDRLVEEAVEEAEKYAAMGFRAIKMKVGRDLADDIRRLEIVPFGVARNESTHEPEPYMNSVPDDLDGRDVHRHDRVDADGQRDAAFEQAFQHLRDTLEKPDVAGVTRRTTAFIAAPKRQPILPLHDHRDPRLQSAGSHGEHAAAPAGPYTSPADLQRRPQHRSHRPPVIARAIAAGRHCGDKPSGLSEILRGVHGDGAENEGCGDASAL